MFISEIWSTPAAVYYADRLCVFLFMKHRSVLRVPASETRAMQVLPIGLKRIREDRENREKEKDTESDLSKISLGAHYYLPRNQRQRQKISQYTAFMGQQRVS